METTILLIEDDKELGAQIVEHLRKAGFRSQWDQEGDLLLPGMTGGIGLVILDLMLPGTYGMDILKRLRDFAEIPVIVLSARNNTEDKIRALRLGADDYMTKPFWPEELIERVRARLRRPVMMKRGPLHVGEVTIDFATRAVTLKGQAVELTRVEFGILAALARRVGEAVTRRWLVDNILDPDKDGTERTLDVHISRLRKKLGGGGLIETVWGIGYRLRGESEA